MIRLYHALRAWLEADAASKGGDVTPQPEGNNFAQAEHAHSYTTEPELHNGYGRRDYYFEDRNRIGFKPNATR